MSADCNCPRCQAGPTKHRLLDENERLREALRQIADANSGQWGWIAHEALHPKKGRP